jgi:hypothetical protein
MPKVYLWDWSSVPDEGARYENLVAGHLLKLKHALEDHEGYSVSLWYLRDVSKREVDFLFTVAEKPWFAVECKKGSKASNASLIYFGERLKIPFLYQLTFEGKEDIVSNNVRVMSAARFLAALP